MERIRRVLGNGFVYELNVNKGEDAHLHLGRADYKCSRHDIYMNVPLNRTPDKKKSANLIIYTLNQKTNKVSQITANQFVNQLFKKYPLDGNQFLDYVKRGLQYYSLTGYTRNTSFTCKDEKGRSVNYTACCIEPTATTPPFLLGIGVGTYGATIILRELFGTRVNVKFVKTSEKVLCQTLLYPQDEIVYKVKGSDFMLCHSLDLIDVSYNVIHDITKVKLPYTPSMPFQKSSSYQELNTDVKEYINTILKKYKPEWDKHIKEYKEGILKFIELIKRLSIDGTVPAAYKTASEKDKKLIQLLDVTNNNLYKSANAVRETIYCRIIDYLEEHFFNGLNSEQCYTEHLPKGFLEKVDPSSVQKESKSNLSQEEITKNIESIITTGVQAAYSTLLDYTDIKTYIKSKYGNVSMKALPKEQLDAIKADIKQNLEKSIHSLAENIHWNVIHYQKEMNVPACYDSARIKEISNKIYKCLKERRGK